eukprot:CAMPEP_0198286510 /NCGR_PEP_ID=MMETSP1449-20131203/5583_1 /TAXON_ID=420275 /ORGANISM="Attheya septentrionalis, Strain CCMP2084" /LENGTH=778 /DNA_ID=CAMNT_0043984279 /DNA_START=20 /DNA_END=2356 /DNA_ORIENTATION=+
MSSPKLVRRTTGKEKKERDSPSDNDLGDDIVQRYFKSMRNFEIRCPALPNLPLKAPPNWLSSRRAQRRNISTIPCHALASAAYTISTQRWDILNQESNPDVAGTADMSVLVERIVALLFIRMVALMTSRSQRRPKGTGSSQDDVTSQKPATFSDLSTSTISKELLDQSPPLPERLTPVVVAELREYVRRICSLYRDMEYHNVKHAYHVVVSANKLLDLMLTEDEDYIRSESAAGGITEASSPTGSKRRSKLPPTYGIRADPMAQLALIFSALVHDVDHPGVTNRQLVTESDEIAILYNDQSPAEQRSLAIAFSMIMEKDFKALRDAIFAEKDEFVSFRRTVINLVMSTDIASPERMQIIKSKWKEAFGETWESLERRKRMSKFTFNQQKSNSNEDSTRKGNQPARPSMIDSFPRVHEKEIMDDELISENAYARTRSEASSSKTPESFDIECVEEEGSDIELNTFDGKIPKEATTPDSNKKRALPWQRHLRPCSLLSQSLSQLDLIKPPEMVSERIESEENGSNQSSSSELNTSGFRTRAGGRSMSMSAVDLRKSIECLKVMDLWDPIEEEESTEKSAQLTQSVRRQRQFRRFSDPPMSAGGLKPIRHKDLRLGIRRAVDLTGTIIVSFGTTRSPHMQDDSNEKFDADEPDELKASVVLEQLLKAADVAANMQGWENMKIWSSRLFDEQWLSFQEARGDDPSSTWFESQITFYESYCLPLARRLRDCKAFDHRIGSIYVKCLEENKKRWLEEGEFLSREFFVEACAKAPTAPNESGSHG